MPSTKHIESNILDLPVPLRPVIAVNSGSNPCTSVRRPYDLKPSSITDFMYIATNTNSTNVERGGRQTVNPFQAPLPLITINKQPLTI